MKTPLETRGSRANDGRSARLGKKQPDGTHAHRIAHVPRVRPACAIVARDRSPAGRSRLFADARAAGVPVYAEIAGWNAVPAPAG